MQYRDRRRDELVNKDYYCMVRDLWTIEMFVYVPLSYSSKLDGPYAVNMIPGTSMATYISLLHPSMVVYMLAW